MVRYTFSLGSKSLKDNLKEWAKVCPFLGWLWSVKRLDDSYPHEFQTNYYQVCLKEARMISQYDLNIKITSFYLVFIGSVTKIPNVPGLKIQNTINLQNKQDSNCFCCRYYSKTKIPQSVALCIPPISPLPPSHTAKAIL